MSTFNVSDHPGLISALGSVAAADLILMAPGSYGTVDIRNETFPPGVVVRSEDPGNRAVITSFNLKNVANITFDEIYFDITLGAGATGGVLAKVENCTNVVLRNSVFDGDAQKVGYGVQIVGGNGVTLEDSEVFRFSKNVLLQGVHNVVIRRNDIHSQDGDGIQVSGAQGLLIEENHIHDAEPLPGSTVHRDMIQFHTSGHTTPTIDVTIRANFLNSGSGPITQSIFMRNEAVDQGQVGGTAMYYRNITIEDQVIYNGHTHGISVGATDVISVRNNTLLENFHDPAANDGSADTPTIITEHGGPWLNNTSGNNIVSKPNTYAALVVQRDDPAAANYYSDLFVNALADGAATLQDLEALPGGLIEQLGVGSSLTRNTGNGEPEPMPDSIIIQSAVSQQGGTIVIAPDNLTIQSYTPPLDFVGEDVIDYTILDTEGLTDSSTITVTVEGTAPNAVPDAVTIGKNSTVPLDPLSNDTAD